MQLYKGYEIKPLGTRSSLTISFHGNGTIPKQLMGEFTSYAIAKEAIDRSLNSLKKGRKPNAKKVSTPTD